MRQEWVEPSSSRSPYPPVALQLCAFWGSDFLSCWFSISMDLVKGSPFLKLDSHTWISPPQRFKARLHLTQEMKFYRLSCSQTCGWRSENNTPCYVFPLFSCTAENMSKATFPSQLRFQKFSPFATNSLLVCCCLGSMPGLPKWHWYFVPNVSTNINHDYHSSTLDWGQEGNILFLKCSYSHVFCAIGGYRSAINNPEYFVVRAQHEGDTQIRA